MYCSSSLVLTESRVPDSYLAGAVFGTGTPGSSNNSLTPLVYGFLTKISSDGSHLIYSRLFGGDQLLCQGSCLTAAPTTLPDALAVDAKGNVTIAGSTVAVNFPVTTGAYQAVCGCTYLSPVGFISRVSADGSQLIWSTFLASGAAVPPIPGNVQSIVLDSSGNVYAAHDGSVAKVSSDGTKLLVATNLGGSQAATIAGLALDSAGNVWVAGHTDSPDFSGIGSVPAGGLDFALELNTTASALAKIFPLLPGTVTQPPAFDSNGNLLLLSSKGNLLRLNPSTFLSAPAVLGVTNAAVLTASPGLAPGEIATFFGVGLGPSPGIVGMPDASGLYPTQLGGVSVVFARAGIPVAAPLLYVSPGQINFQVPFGFSDGKVTVTTPTGALPDMDVPAVSSVGIFHQTGSDYAAALNQDGSVNSASNPATAGSIISLYVTGLGGSVLQQDGAIGQAGGSFEKNIQVALGPLSQFNAFPPPLLGILYLGHAPGLINGLAQINVQLPAGVTDPELTVEIFGVSPASSNTVRVYVH